MFCLIIWRQITPTIIHKQERVEDIINERRRRSNKRNQLIKKYLPNNWEKVLRLLTNLWTPFDMLGKRNKKPEGFFIFTSEVLFSHSSLPKIEVIK